MKKYRISPSLLNKVSDWLNSDEIYEAYWGRSERPPMVADEFRAKQLAELLSYLNREPQPPCEAADRGTALNEAIDRLNGRCSRGDIGIQYDGQSCRVRIGERVFSFDRPMVESLALMFKTATPQFHLSHTYETGGRSVELHGFADYIFPTMIWDLKTTARYDGEKYAGNWQRMVYPLVAIDSGALTTCDRFTFYVLELQRDRERGVWTGKPFTETYPVYVDDFRSQVLEFIDAEVVPHIDKWIADGLIVNQRVCSDE